MTAQCDCKMTKKRNKKRWIALVWLTDPKDQRAFLCARFWVGGLLLLTLALQNSTNMIRSFLYYCLRFCVTLLLRFVTLLWYKKLLFSKMGGKAPTFAGIKLLSIANNSVRFGEEEQSNPTPPQLCTLMNRSLHSRGQRQRQGSARGCPTTDRREPSDAARRAGKHKQNPHYEIMNVRCPSSKPRRDKKNLIE
jgi:hypothetical protein